MEPTIAVTANPVFDAGRAEIKLGLAPSQVAVLAALAATSTAVAVRTKAGITTTRGTGIVGRAHGATAALGRAAITNVQRLTTEFIARASSTRVELGTFGAKATDAETRLASGVSRTGAAIAAFGNTLQTNAKGLGAKFTTGAARSSVDRGTLGAESPDAVA